MLLEEYILKSGIGTKNLNSPEDLDLYENTIWEFLDNLLVSYKYHKKDITAVKCAYDTACHYHRNEKRKLGSPYIIHPSQVLERLIEQHHDFETLAAGVLHDTVEAQQGNGYGDTESCLDEVFGYLNSRLVFSHVGEYIERLFDVRVIVGALTRSQTQDFFQAVDQILELDEINILRTYTIKCTDRYVNALDTVGYGVKETLYEVFKTFYIANEANRYMADRMRLFRRAAYRTQDFIGFMGDIFRTERWSALRDLGSSLRQYMDIRNTQVEKRQFLMESIGATLDNLSAEVNTVLDNQTNRLQDIVSGQRSSKRAQELKIKFHKVRMEVEHYGASGGFKRITRARAGSRLDGKMEQYTELVRNKAKRREHKPDLEEQYLDCVVFKKLLLRIGSDYFQNFFIKGLGGHKGITTSLTTIW